MSRQLAREQPSFLFSYYPPFGRMIMTTAIVPSSDSPLLARVERRTALAPVLAAVPRQRVRGIHTDPIGAANVVLSYLPRIQSLRDDIARSLPDFELGHIEHLEVYALTVIDAQTDTNVCVRRDPELPALAKRGFVLRGHFMASARALVRHKLFEPHQLKKLRRPSGYLNLTKDLLLFVVIFQHDWSRYENRCPITRADLMEAAHIAAEISRRAGSRERTPEALREARDRRARAFTLLVESYNEVRAAVVFLRRKQGDANHYAPPLTRRKRRRKRNRAPAVSPRADVVMP
jgi:hypothetical protein